MLIVPDTQGGNINRFEIMKTGNPSFKKTVTACGKVTAFQAGIPAPVLLSSYLIKAKECLHPFGLTPRQFSFILISQVRFSLMEIIHLSHLDQGKRSINLLKYLVCGWIFDRYPIKILSTPPLSLSCLLHVAETADVVCFRKIMNWWRTRASLNKVQDAERQLYTRWEQDYDLQGLGTLSLFEEYLEMGECAAESV